MFANTQTQQKRQQEEATYHRLLTQIEYMTSHGDYHLPEIVKQLRYEYYTDFQYLMDMLQQIGMELKSYPGKLTLFLAISLSNDLLYVYMYSASTNTSFTRSTCTMQSIILLSYVYTIPYAYYPNILNH